MRVFFSRDLLLGSVALASVCALSAGPASSQSAIATELTTLEAQFVSAHAASLPAGWTGGQTGLSLVFVTSSSLKVSSDELTDAHRDAARAICRKVGVGLVTQNKQKPGLEALRFFVIELKRNLLSLGPIKGNMTIGLVFDVNNDCAELR
jgi:hypothetical protein